jgi:hypothetical protein
MPWTRYFLTRTKKIMTGRSDTVDIAESVPKAESPYASTYWRSATALNPVW